jgi:hypothetical protein
MGDRRSFCQSSWRQVRSPGACHIPYEVQSNRHLLQKLASCLLHAIQMHQQLKNTAACPDSIVGLLCAQPRCRDHLSHHGSAMHGASLTTSCCRTPVSAICCRISALIHLQCMHAHNSPNHIVSCTDLYAPVQARQNPQCEPLSRILAAMWYVLPCHTEALDARSRTADDT